MKRIAASAIILVQLWMLSPVCCCSFKAAANGGGGDCCCSSDESDSSNGTPAEKDPNCRCSSSKIELPPQTAAVHVESDIRDALHQVLIAANVSLVDVKDASNSREFHEWPPPLAVTDRLATLQRLNL